MVTPAHFNHAGMSPSPSVVLDRMLEHLQLEAELGGYEAEAAVEAELEQVPAKLASVVGAAADEIVPTESATAAWDTVLWSIRDREPRTHRRRILVDAFTYGTVWSGVAHFAAVTEAEVEIIGSREDGSVDPEALARAVDERVGLVLVTHMPTHQGTVADVGAVRAALEGTGVIFALDIAQTLGQMPIDVKAIGCDIAFAPGRKFLRAPRGTGLAYVRAAFAESLVPLTPPFGSTATDLPPAALRFRQFEFGVAARLALGTAAAHAATLGLDRIATLVEERSRAVVQLLVDTPGITLTCPAESRGIVSFVHRSLDPFEVKTKLAALGVTVWVSVPAGAPLHFAAGARLPSVRVSPHYTTTDDELDRLKQGLAAL